MKQTIETKTLQVWPRGEGFEYAGDVHDLEGRKLRKHSWNGDKPQSWTPGTPEDWRKIQIEELAEMYASRDILVCDSSLVDDLIKQAGEMSGDLGDGFGYEEIRNLYKDPSDWDADACRDYLSDHGLDAPERPTITVDPEDGSIPHRGHCAMALYPAAECTCGKADGTLEIPDYDADDDDWRFGYLRELRDACREHAQDNPAEVYEWWRVSSWLCDKLHEIGEVTIDNGYGHWWGRTCTGQAYIMDGTLQQIAAQFVEAIQDSNGNTVGSVTVRGK